MVHFMTVSDKKYAPYAIAFPNDMTCWHFPKGCNLLPNEATHLAVITARARDGDVYLSAELEKGLLKIPERVKRSRTAKIAALKRKLRRLNVA